MKGCKTVFLKWFLVASVMICLSFMSFKLGYYEDIYNGDKTKLTFLLFTILAYNTFKLGNTSYKISRDDLSEEDIKVPLHNAKFSSQLAMGIGMAGTTIGIIMMLSHFGMVDVNNIKTIQDFFLILGTGLGTALWTTLIGLLTAMLINIQIHILTSHFLGKKVQAESIPKVPEKPKVEVKESKVEKEVEKKVKKKKTKKKNKK